MSQWGKNYSQPKTTSISPNITFLILGQQPCRFPTKISMNPIWGHFNFAHWWILKSLLLWTESSPNFRRNQFFIDELISTTLHRESRESTLLKILVTSKSSSRIETKDASGNDLNHLMCFIPTHQVRAKWESILFPSNWKMPKCNANFSQEEKISLIGG